MKKLFKCTVCNFLFGRVKPLLPSAPSAVSRMKKFNELPAESADKIYQSERTNDIHMEMITLIDKVIELAYEGIELNLDPNCVNTFKQAVDERLYHQTAG